MPVTYFVISSASNARRKDSILRRRALTSITPHRLCETHPAQALKAKQRATPVEMLERRVLMSFS
jgi:hypothetical protein